MDLEKLPQSSDTQVVELYLPDTEEPILDDSGVPFSVTIHGPYSSRYKEITEKTQNRRLRMAQKSGRRLKVTAAEIRDEVENRMIQCVEDWNIQLGGKKLPCTEENIRDIFSRYGWIRDQVYIAMEDSSSFLES